MSNNQSALRSSLSVLGKLFLGTRKGTSGERARLLRNCQKTIGVRFTDLSLLEQALTHRSYSHVTAQTRNDSNERMEFLGDSVLGLSVSQFLYLRFRDRSEGALSKMKSLLVSRKVLSAVARDCGLGEYILLSGEESEMGGRDRASILADSFEGVIGAIYLDQGYRAANGFIQRFLLANISGILDDDEHTNYKSLLQEYVQSRRLSHPVYRVRKEEGPEHEKEFAIDVVVKGQVWGTGRGKSKKDAEQSAARAALEQRQGEEPRKRGRGRAGEADGTVEAPRSAPAGREARAPREGRAGRERQEGQEGQEGREGRARRTETAESPRASRSRGRVRPEEASASAEAVDRAGHGIAASRESLRRSREETSQEPRVERKGRSRSRAERIERTAPADAPQVTGSETPDRPEAADGSDRSGRPARSSRRRRGGRGSGERRRAEEARATSAEPTPLETESRPDRSRDAEEAPAARPSRTEEQAPAASRSPEPRAESRPEPAEDAPGFVRRRRRTERPRAAGDSAPPQEAARTRPSVNVVEARAVEAAPRAVEEAPPVAWSEPPPEPVANETHEMHEDSGANGSSFARRKKRSSRGLRRR